MLVGLAGCGSASTSTNTHAATATNGQLGTITWAPLEGEPRSLAIGDATAGYPEMTVVSNLCDNVLRLTPQGKVEPGIATIAAHPNPLTYVFKMRSGPKFWDGHPVTAADAVFSLRQSIEPTAANDFVLSDVKSVQQTGSDEFMIALRAPDVAFPDYLASDAGTVAEKSYVLAKGSSYGTPAGGVMCSGPFKLGSWVRGKSLTIERNSDYWDSALEPHVHQIKFMFITDPTTLTSALLSGEVDGTFAAPPEDLARLQSSSSGGLTQGASLQVASLSLTATTGPLANAKVREAYNIAVDRSAFVKAAYYGAAEPNSSAILPPTWSYEHSTFQQAYDALPGGKPEVAKAAKLVTEAGFKGASITIATSAEPTLTPIALYLQSVADHIGLKAKLKQYASAAQFLTLFYEAKAREGIDAIVNINYTLIPEPLDFLSTLALPEGLNNYDGYSDPQVTSLISEALAAKETAQRAKLITEADALYEQAPNTIMLAVPKIELWQSSRLTGAVASGTYWSFPWGTLLRPTT
jgi:peptide/nickel transport system substrate-binding protein